MFQVFSARHQTRGSSCNVQPAAAANHKGLFTDCDVGGRHGVGDGGERAREDGRGGVGGRQEAGFDLLLALRGEDGGSERRKPPSGEETVNHSERREGECWEGPKGEDNRLHISPSSHLTSRHVGSTEACSTRWSLLKPHIFKNTLGKNLFI